MSEKMWIDHFKKMSQGQIPQQQGYFVVESYKSNKNTTKPQAKKRKKQQKIFDLFKA